MKPAADARSLTSVRAARLAARDRRVSVRRQSRATRRSWTSARGYTCARAVATLGIAPLHEHVSVRREPAASNRLPPRGPRLRWAHGGDRQRRVDLAAADQPDAHAHHLVFDERAARLRRDAARSALRELRGSRGALRVAAERAGSSRRGSWGPGRVELVQISTPDETNDNIVAYWVPDRVPPPGQPLDFSYRMQWQLHTAETAARRLRGANARGPGLSARSPTTSSSSSSTSPGLRSTSYRPTRR